MCPVQQPCGALRMAGTVLGGKGAPFSSNTGSENNGHKVQETPKPPPSPLPFPSLTPSSELEMNLQENALT